MSHVSRGYTFALCSALLFGLNGSVAKIILEGGVSPGQLTLGRALCACILSGIVLAITDRSAFRVSLRQLLTFAVLGVIGVSGSQFFYAASLQTLPVGIAILINYTSVVMVALVAFFVFRERVRPRFWAALALVLVGLAMVAQVWSGALHPTGVMYGFIAAGCITIYFLVGERAVTACSPLGVGFWCMSFASLFWIIIGDWRSMDWSDLAANVSMQGTLDAVHLPLWIPLLWVVTMGSFMPYFLSFLSLKYLPAMLVGVLASSEVFFSFTIAWVWLEESMNTIQLIGAAAVMFGIISAQTAREHRVTEVSLVTQGIPIQTR